MVQVNNQERTTTTESSPAAQETNKFKVWNFNRYSFASYL